MGEVIPIRQPRCRCGWQLPFSLEVHITGRVFVVEGETIQSSVSFKCPCCLSPIRCEERPLSPKS